LRIISLINAAVTFGGQGSEQLPFEGMQIPFKLQAGNNGHVNNGTLTSNPYQGNWSLSTNATLNQVQNDVVTQIWTFLFSPVGTCQLDGDYVFSFDIIGYPGVEASVTFHLTSQYFCGQVVNTSALGQVEFFSDESLSEVATSFQTNSNAYVLITVESGFLISEVIVTNATVNNQNYPLYLLGEQRQVNYGVTFSQELTEQLFDQNENVLEYVVEITYSSNGKKSIERRDSNGQPSSVTIKSTLTVKIPSSSTSNTQGASQQLESSNNAHKSNSASIAIPIGIVCGITGITAAGIVFFVLWRRRKQQKQPKEVENTNIAG